LRCCSTALGGMCPYSIDTAFGLHQRIHAVIGTDTREQRK
jgi:hypothetical protein